MNVTGLCSNGCGENTLKVSCLQSVMWVSTCFGISSVLCTLIVQALWTLDSQAERPGMLNQLRQKNYSKCIVRLKTSYYKNNIILPTIMLLY